MPADTKKEEALLKLITVAVTEMHILLNKIPPGKFREDAKFRIENIIASMWSLQG